MYDPNAAKREDDNRKDAIEKARELTRQAAQRAQAEQARVKAGNEANIPWKPK